MSELLLAAEQRTALATTGTRRSVRARLWRHAPAMLSLAVLIVVAVACAAAPLFEQWLGMSADAQDLFARFSPPSAGHWLGTDALGRDVFLRLLYGGRISLVVGLVTTLSAAMIGTAIGLVSGYYGGRIDGLLMRFTDIVIALPLLPLLIVLAAVDPAKLGLGDEIARSDSIALWRIIIILAVVGWTGVARLVRAATLAARRRTYVLAATALGVSDRAILWRHILPNVLSPVIIATTLSVGNVILLESVLSFLGLGIQPPMPSWGNLLTNAQSVIWQAPWLAIWPGLAIFVTVMGFNLLGDGLQQALNPKSAGSRH